MRIVDTTCTKCGANLHIDADRKTAFCEYCGAQLLIDDEVQHLQIDNAESAGYAFEKGRQRAQNEAQAQRYYSAQPQPAPKMVGARMDIYFSDPADYHYIAQQKTENRREDRDNRCRVDRLSVNGISR